MQRPHEPDFFAPSRPPSPSPYPPPSHPPPLIPRYLPPDRSVACTAVYANRRCAAQVLVGDFGKAEQAQYCLAIITLFNTIMLGTPQVAGTPKARPGPPRLAVPPILVFLNYAARPPPLSAAACVAMQTVCFYETS